MPSLRRFPPPRPPDRVFFNPLATPCSRLYKSPYPMQNFLPRLLKWLGLAAAALVVVVIGFAAFWIFTLMRDLPSVETLQDYAPPVTTRVYAGNGTVLGEYAHQRRIFVPASFIPKRVKQAFTSAEDRNFYNHPGIDPSGILRAAIKDVGLVLEGRRPQGASTITQQVARGFLLNSDLKMARKVREAILAVRIDATYPKEKVLELYLNEINLGQNNYGGAAAFAQQLRSALPSPGRSRPPQLGDRPDGRQWLRHRGPGARGKGRAASHPDPRPGQPGRRRR